MKHKHIKIKTPNGAGHVTWTGKKPPTAEQIKTFEKLAILAFKEK